MHLKFPFQSVLIITTAVLILLTSATSQGQSIWYGREKVNSVNLEFSKPFTPSDSLGPHEIPGLNPLSGSIFLTGRYSLKSNKNITFVADIPIAHGNIEDTIITNGSEWMFGNPYIGAEFDIPNSPVYFELGLRLPLAPDDKGTAEFAGAVSDFDRSEAFLSKRFPVYGAVNFATVSDSKILFTARGGLSLWFNSDSLRVQSSPAVHVDYHLQTGYIIKSLNVIFTLSGRQNLSSNAIIKDKEHVIQYGLSIVVPYKKIRPALSFRFPGNKPADRVLNFVAGLNFGYVF